MAEQRLAGGEEHVETSPMKSTLVKSAKDLPLLHHVATFTGTLGTLVYFKRV